MTDSLLQLAMDPARGESVGAVGGRVEREVGGGRWEVGGGRWEVGGGRWEWSRGGGEGEGEGEGSWLV